jgi:hypothetical protein
MRLTQRTTERVHGSSDELLPESSSAYAADSRERFMGLGLGRYEAIRAVEDAIDWYSVEALLKTGSTLAVALEISP